MNNQHIIISPLNQFEIRDILDLNILGYLHLSLTNIGLYLTIGCFFIFTLSLLSTNYNKLIPNS
jgi:F-type H+-transporting ATPase subunit a